MESHGRSTSLLGPSDGSGRGTEGRVNIARSEVGRLKREIAGLSERVKGQEVDIGRLIKEKEQLIRECERRGNRIEELEHKVGFYQEDVQRQSQYTWAKEERLKQTQDLLETKSAELTGAQAFLSTSDGKSEEEVLGIVHDLNETIYQVAVDLTEEWEKFESSHTTSPMGVDPTSRPCVSALVQLVRNRDPVGLTFLLQSSLCSKVVSMTSSWGYQESAVLESIYQRLSASGEHHRRRQVMRNSHIIEGQAISARWRSLAHSHLFRPPPHPAPLVEELANVLDHTGSFQSTQHSVDFVQAVALEGIETIIRHVMRSESAFKVEVTSSDISLLFEGPGTVFDDARMTNDFGSDGAPAPERQDKIAGTTEVGVGKSVCVAGKSSRKEILLKTKVVLEKDVI